MPIDIIDYDPGWPVRFEDERARIAAALGPVALRIDHIGSTSVPGMPAKPVIDIQVSVRGATPESDFRERLVGLGYTYTTVPFPYFHKPAAWPHTHHVHVRETGTADERRTLAFRDWLRDHPGVRADYAALKRSLAADADAKTAAGRFRYSEGKTEFVRRIEVAAAGGRGAPRQGLLQRAVGSGSVPSTRRAGGVGVTTMGGSGMSTILEVTDATFDQEVLESGLPTLVDFWGDHCPACIQISPILEALAEKHDGRVRIVKVHAAQNPAASTRFGVRAMPTVLGLRDGHVEGQLVGARPRADFEALIERLM